MNKIINFLKTNYFIKGLIFLVMGFIVIWVRGGLLLKANIIVGYGLLKLIADILWVISLVLFIVSAVKEGLIFKVISAVFVFLISIWLIRDIFIETKYGIQRYKEVYKDVTNEYNQCVLLWNKAVENFPSDLPPYCIDFETCRKRNDALTKFMNEIEKARECQSKLFDKKSILTF
jgi:hypothetical protein